jgi:hypothetical protein
MGNRVEETKERSPTRARMVIRYKILALIEILQRSINNPPVAIILAKSF